LKSGSFINISKLTINEIMSKLFIEVNNQRRILAKSELDERRQHVAALKAPELEDK
jgi:hypothetical protein